VWVGSSPISRRRCPQAFLGRGAALEHLQVGVMRGLQLTVIALVPGQWWRPPCSAPGSRTDQVDLDAVHLEHTTGRSNGPSSEVPHVKRRAVVGALSFVQHCDQDVTVSNLGPDRLGRAAICRNHEESIVHLWRLSRFVRGRMIRARVWRRESGQPRVT
jgi:hypothetical protein